MIYQQLTASWKSSTW